jgi:hypothetical protein
MMREWKEEEREIDDSMASVNKFQLGMLLSDAGSDRQLMRQILESFGLKKSKESKKLIDAFAEDEEE